MALGGLAPISAASTIIGFVSFGFTLATFFRVFWGNLMTMVSAPDEIEDYLGNLKQALYEERDHLRRVRRRNKGEYDEGAFRILHDTVKHLIRDFKKLERPYLLNADDRMVDSKGRYYQSDRDEPDDYYNMDYKQCNFWDRWRWVKTRGKVIDLSDKLARVQGRRVVKQTTDSALATAFLARSMLDIEDRLDRMDQRLGRLVGVRRND